MGINDWGRNPADPLANPKLGEPGGWADAVAATLDRDDTPVSQRIAAATDPLEARVGNLELDADDVAALLGLMGNPATVYSNAQHIIPRTSGTEPLQNPLELPPWTNPLAFPLTVEVLWWGYLYLIANTGSVYLQAGTSGAVPDGFEDITSGIRPERLVYPLSGATYFGSIRGARGHYRVPAGGTVTFNAAGRTTQGANGDAYVQYISGMVRVLGPAPVAP